MNEDRILRRDVLAIFQAKGHPDSDGFRCVCVSCKARSAVEAIPADEVAEAERELARVCSEECDGAEDMLNANLAIALGKYRVALLSRDGKDRKAAEELSVKTPCSHCGGAKEVIVNKGGGFAEYEIPCPMCQKEKS